MYAHYVCISNISAECLGNIELVFGLINVTSLSHEYNTLDMTLLMIVTIQVLQNSA